VGKKNVRARKHGGKGARPAKVFLVKGGPAFDLKLSERAEGTRYITETEGVASKDCVTGPAAKKKKRKKGGKSPEGESNVHEIALGRDPPFSVTAEVRGLRWLLARAPNEK